MKYLKTRGKLLLLSASIAIVALVLSGCFLMPPTVRFISPTSLNNSAYPVNSPITFSWSGESGLTYTLTLSASGIGPITLLSNSNLTTYQTSIATPGVYTAQIVGKTNLGGTGKDTTTFNVTSLKITNSATIYAKNSVTVSWESLDNKPHTYLYSIDNGASWTSTTQTSATLTNLPDGNYTFMVKLAQSYVPPAVYNFEILTAGPTIGIAVSDRTEGGFYGIGSHPQGRYAEISWASNQPLGALLVRFYMYGPLGTGIRYRLNISPNGQWVVLPATSTAQQWYLIPHPNTNTDMIISATGPGSLQVYDMSGNAYNVPAFQLGQTYAIGMLPVNWLGTQGSFAIAPFVLSERYGLSNMPQMYVGYNTTSVATGGSFVASVYAPNLTAYASGTHQIVNDNVDHTDITTNNGLMYMQFSVQLSPGLQLNSVTFPDMMAGKVNLWTYKYDPNTGILTVYRGFVNPVPGAPVAQSATDIAVQLQCTVPATYSGSYAFASVVYEGYFGNEGYSNLNPVFKDNSLRNIDGVVILRSVPVVTVGSAQ
ncbi:hypothetical protein [Athalassotoga saccharophila]|uniref:hypothetical protein n=1 Tax=Athalassotoga saccharophila TaxID=1441386 RepID=UPI0013795DC7|nr:hypothetical protein [Athalassotoga saccharophila]